MTVVRERAATWWCVSLLGAIAVAATAGADEVQLRGGGRLTGVIVQKTEASVAIETGPGLVTIPMSRVERIVASRSALEVWLERSAALSPGDSEGWAALARWAESRDLATQAQVAWQRVLARDAQNAEANAALGRVQSNGVWLSREEAYRAQGLVPFEGRWISPAEQESLLRQREAETEAALARREAELRAREAEARAREAEARANEAEATAEPSEAGIPLWGAYGPFMPPWGYAPGDRDGHTGRGRGDADGSTTKPSPGPPAPTPPPSSLGPVRVTAPPSGKPADGGSKRRQPALD